MQDAKRAPLCYMGKSKRIDKLDEMEDASSGIVSDLATDLYEMLPSRKEKEVSEKEKAKREAIKQARKEAAGKVAGWGDYKFDWEK